MNLGNGMVWREAVGCLIVIAHGHRSAKAGVLTMLDFVFVRRYSLRSNPGVSDRSCDIGPQVRRSDIRGILWNLEGFCSWGGGRLPQRSGLRMRVSLAAVHRGPGRIDRFPLQGARGAVGGVLAAPYAAAAAEEQPRAQRPPPRQGHGVGFKNTEIFVHVTGHWGQVQKPPECHEIAENPPKKLEISAHTVARAVAFARAAIVDSRTNSVIPLLPCARPSHRLWILAKLLHNSHLNITNFTPCYFLSVFLPGAFRRKYENFGDVTVSRS
ncbi:hypothetical protein B0H14DRAFT_2648431 [Mycena olivaceomarginata]|nr:hypothetical protein B0H14DRAFT_2648431 [Mycena olivaceomarginata]